jgi:hypothetical protein
MIYVYCSSEPNSITAVPTDIMSNTIMHDFKIPYMFLDNLPDLQPEPAIPFASFFQMYHEKDGKSQALPIIMEGLEDEDFSASESLKAIKQDIDTYSPYATLRNQQERDYVRPNVSLQRRRRSSGARTLYENF